MQIRAILKRTSTAYRRWRAHKRRAGKLNGVRFVLVGQDYLTASSPTTPDEIQALRHNSMVSLEMMSNPPAGVVEEAGIDSLFQSGDDGDNDGQGDGGQGDGDQGDDGQDDGQGGDAGTDQAELNALFGRNVPDQPPQPIKRRPGGRTSSRTGA
jgi:hypothetical protein